MSNVNYKIYRDKISDNISTNNIQIRNNLDSRETQNITSSFHKSGVDSHSDMVAIEGNLPVDVITWATYDGKDIVTLSMKFQKSSSGVDDVLEFDWPIQLNRIYFSQFS